MNTRHLISDLFFLPIRVTRLLGLIGSDVLVRRRLGTDNDEQFARSRRVVESLLDQYGNAVVARSDVQAPDLVVSACVARETGWVDPIEEVLGRIFFDLATSNNAVARLGLGPKQITEFLRGRAENAAGIHPRLLANPSNLLSALLFGGVLLQLDDIWDQDLIAFDHRSCNYFIPADYRDFGKIRIEKGVNHGFDIGHGVWTLADVESFIASRDDEIKMAARGLSPAQSASALVASRVLPDRLPLFVCSENKLRGAPRSNIG